MRQKSKGKVSKEFIDLFTFVIEIETTKRCFRCLINEEKFQSNSIKKSVKIRQIQF